MKIAMPMFIISAVAVFALEIAVIREHIVAHGSAINTPANLADGEFVRAAVAWLDDAGKVCLRHEVCRHLPGGKVECVNRDVCGAEVRVTFGDVQ